MPETPNRQHRSDQAEGRDDRIHPRAVMKSRVHHRTCLIDASAKWREQPVNGVHDMRRVVEPHVGPFKMPVTFDVDVGWTVHHHFTDRRIPQQHFEWSQPKNLVDHRLNHPSTPGVGNDVTLVIQQPFNDATNGVSVDVRSQRRSFIGRALTQVAHQFTSGEITERHGDPFRRTRRSGAVRLGVRYAKSRTAVASLHVDRWEARHPRAAHRRPQTHATTVRADFPSSRST